MKGLIIYDIFGRYIFISTNAITAVQQIESWFRLYYECNGCASIKDHLSAADLIIYDYEEYLKKVGAI